MSFTKRISALIMICAMVFTCLALTACHQKGETVVSVKIDDKTYDISSGVYLALQFEAFNKFANNVNSDLESGTTISNPDDYLHQDYTVSGKNAVDWIDSETLKIIKQYVGVLYLFEKEGLEMSSSDQSTVDQYLSYYWDQNGYKTTYERNGISKASYRTVLEYSIKKSKLFSFYYDSKSEQESTNGSKSDKIVKFDELAKIINDKYFLADSLSLSLTSNKTDEEGNTVPFTDTEKESFKAKLTGYAERINNGSATFETIKKEFDAEQGNETTESEDTTASTDEVKDEDGNVLTSIYPSTAALASKDDQDTANFDRYTELKKDKGDQFKYGTAYVLTNDESNYYLVILYDLSKDSYQIEKNRSALLNELKNDEFEELLEKTVAEDAMTVFDSLVKYYTPDNLKFKDEEN